MAKVIWFNGDKWHLTCRIARKVLAHTVAIFINQQLGRKPLQFDWLNTFKYFSDVLDRLPNHKANKIHELFPYHWQASA